MKRFVRRFVQVLGCTAAAALACAASLATAQTARWVGGSLEDQIDRAVRDGHERPAPAQAALERLRASQAEESSSMRSVQLGLVLLHAQSRQASAAQAAADDLAARAAAGDEVARAVASLARAVAADAAGQHDLAAAHAQPAALALQAACHPPVAETCDYRAAWRSLRLLQRRAQALGAADAARDHERAALAIATEAGDAERQVMSLGTLALLQRRAGPGPEASRLLAQAHRLAAGIDDARVLARLLNDEADVTELDATPAALRTALELRERALKQAQRAQGPRLLTQMLVNLGDTHARLNQHGLALDTAERALRLARQLGDGDTERVLLHNIGIAKIGLGRIEEGQRDLAHVLALWRSTGQSARQAESLREFGAALLAAGDPRGALALYHQERELSAALMRDNRAEILKDLQQRNNAEAQQRSIALLAHDNALKTEALANNGLRQRIVLLVAAVMGLSIVLAGVLYRRVRNTHRQLSASHAQLRVQSERDPLTGLANRRHVHAALGQQQRFEGALLLIDVDHFKRINDRIGHAGGDEVLVEVARRLQAATRRDDLVARWGGEEFMIIASRATAEQAEQLAARVLQIVSGTPVRAGGTALQVTASVGYARLPLPHSHLPVSWEQAVNLVDQALYAAKRAGRHCAIGLQSTNCADAHALQQVADDFEAARRDGRITVLGTPGAPLDSASPPVNGAYEGSEAGRSSASA